MTFNAGCNGGPEMVVMLSQQIGSSNYSGLRVTVTNQDGCHSEKKTTLSIQNGIFESKLLKYLSYSYSHIRVIVTPVAAES